MANITKHNLAQLHKQYVESCNDHYNVEKMQNEYDKESLILHSLLSNESFYCPSSKEDGTKRTLEYVAHIYPGTTAEEVETVYNKYFYLAIEIYG
jgi:hypothetical protein